MTLRTEMLWKPWSWLYVVCFLDLFGASLIMPMFSAHLRSLGVSHTDIGLLSSIYGATQLISGPVIGSWSDINGRSQILCLSMIICSVAYGLMGIISSFAQFFFIRCVLGSFKHTQTLSRAFISDIVPEEKQASVHGIMNAFTSFSFTIGPVISGHMMEMENGFLNLTRTVMLIFILNTTVVYIFANKTDKSFSKESYSERRKLYEDIVLVFKELYNIKWTSFWALFSVKFLFALTGMLFFQNMGVILTENFEISHKSMGYTISFYGFVSVLCNLGVGQIKHSGFLPKSNLKSLTYTFFMMAVTFCLLYVTNSYQIFVLGIIPLSSSHALTRILLTEVLLEQSDASCVGSVVGASSSITSIARILVPFISGLIISWGGVSCALLVSSVIAFGACLLTVLYTQTTDKSLKPSSD
ncbi:major facilitator superfamily domain-containing protein 9-like [Macrosteles quadrilineatus]|uniref:major facilitator superfamily domain-containing protein 9-like n=1 Tax=Macrosteles quadrilineatus TaxID=74068 RepID=UPI0023E2AC71|nr:major facilitator superfamily domain-containing protein 9-like [Macrosteles quadrilineatus]